MEKILSLLRNNARLSNQELGVMLGISEEEAARQVKALEKEGVIKGYLTVCNESKVDNAPVHAMIELKVVPMKEMGLLVLYAHHIGMLGQEVGQRRSAAFLPTQNKEIRPE